MLSRPLTHVCITYKRTKDSRFETLVLKFEAHTFYHPNTTKRPAQVNRANYVCGSRNMKIACSLSYSCFP